MFDEMLGPGGIRPEYQEIATWVEKTGLDALLERRPEAEDLFRKVGITFAVYHEGSSEERLIPFDMIPRVFSAQEWDTIERGCIQRAKALNAFLTDVYGEQAFIKAGKIPAELVLNNPAYEPAMVGVQPPGGVWSHICGICDKQGCQAFALEILYSNGKQPHCLVRHHGVVKLRDPDKIDFVTRNNSVASRG